MECDQNGRDFVRLPLKYRSPCNMGMATELMLRKNRERAWSTQIKVLSSCDLSLTWQLLVCIPL